MVEPQYEDHDEEGVARGGDRALRVSGNLPGF